MLLNTMFVCCDFIMLRAIFSIWVKFLRFIGVPGNELTCIIPINIGRLAAWCKNICWNRSIVHYGIWIIRYNFPKILVSSWFFRDFFKKMCSAVLFWFDFLLFWIFSQRTTHFQAILKSSFMNRLLQTIKRIQKFYRIHWKV